ncbi:MAG: hypothetical protein FLDDKLPJ_00150 [Phycisphaerae bacterium]|nr:hypothetical protein [Phycisphaerae bacterium]
MDAGQGSDARRASCDERNHADPRRRAIREVRALPAAFRRFETRGAAVSSRLSRVFPLDPAERRRSKGTAARGCASRHGAVLACATAWFLLASITGCLNRGQAAPKGAVAFDPQESWQDTDAPAEAAPDETAIVQTDIDEFLEELRRAQPSSGAGSTSSDVPPATQQAPVARTADARPIDGDDRVSSKTDGANAAVSIDADAPGPAIEAAAELSGDSAVSTESAPALPVIKVVRVARGAGPTASDAGSSPAPAEVSNQPVDASPPAARLSISEYLEQLGSEECELSPVERAWRGSLIGLALGDAGRAADLSAELAPNQRELLTVAADAISAARRAMLDPATGANAALAAAQQLQEILSPLADLSMPTTALCRRVLTFGVYEAMPADQFVAGRVNHTILYCEVRNFASQPEEGVYVSRFESRVELLTADGRSVWEQPPANIEDRCTRRRSDFFIAHRLTLPPTIPAGEYVLKVELHDKLAGKMNESATPLTLLGGLSLTRGE